MTKIVVSAAVSRGINKIGNIFCPGIIHQPGTIHNTGGLPRFSDTGCSAHAHEILASLQVADQKGLLALMWLASFLPGFVLRIFISALKPFHYFPGIIGNETRKLSFGLRGFLFSLYYSGRGDLMGPSRIPNRLGFDLKT